MTNYKNSDTLFQSLFSLYAILILHVFLVAILGCLVIFFRGIVIYAPWIFLSVFLIIIGSGYYFYRRMKKEGKTLREILNTPDFNGRTVEISFLGGFASLKIGGSSKELIAGGDSSPKIHQLDSPEKYRTQELTELVRMLEKGLITLEEYEIAKKHIFK
ncbi:MAG TPA: hypothetical protein DD405_05125 [Desulfobacteraceae bacterium]|nr:hypothetical protein [Desulfobacteraceae bacterium]